MSSGIPKLNNIIVLRSFAILAVVVYHCYCPWLFVWDWYKCPARPIYSFIMEVVLVGRMPLFVFVSGYLFSHLFLDRGKYHNFIGFLQNKSKRLLIPLLFFSCLMTLILGGNLIGIFTGYTYHLWFLKMLFLCFMSIWILATYIKNIKLEFLFLGISVLMKFIPAPSFFALNQFLKYFFFFYFGYLFYKYRNSCKWVYSNLSFLSLLSIYLCLCFICLIRYLKYPIESSGEIIHSDKIVVLCRMILRPVTILLAFVIVDYYLRHSPKFIKFFDSLNQLSYGIYLWHVFLLEIIHKFFISYTVNFAQSHYIIAPLILSLIIITFSIIITYLIRRLKWGVYLVG